ncbi:MAG: geranylgeranyl reductase family protein [Acidilobaceae archaeon]|nr:geranylgeranyl reductase family protein [Acidilobaceae archaeon]MCX8165116.1 geranylgeranyl reductase family protein [Acidilobaceae archaeon]MDW7974368.1 geranylgeranyl reductase family protein [Sulfolobales archaeon]
MRANYDVVVVGLGPAGASLVYMLRNSGLRVAGIDMGDESKIWGKPCGDAIGSGNFDKNGLPHPSGEALKQIVRGALIYSPSEQGVLRLTGGHGYMIDRNKYGLSLLREASGKVDIYLETKVSNPILESGKLAGVMARGEKGEMELRAKVVVDASGSVGSVRRKLPAEWPVAVEAPETDFSVAYRKIVELDYDIEEPDFIRIYFSTKIAPGGYWWFFPKGKNVANIGLGVQLGRGYEHPAKTYREVLMKRPDIGREVRVLSEAGARLPTRRPIATMVWHNFIAIGDSAFTVDPVHGGGMGYAMTAARAAANAIVAAAETGDFSAKGLWGANLEYMRALGAKQAALDVLRMFLQTLSDEEIEWAISKGLVGKEEVIAVFEAGEFSLTRHFLDTLDMVVRLMGKPTLFGKILKVNDYMKKIKGLYMDYPESPEGLLRWNAEVEELVAEYKRVMNIPF